MKIFTKFYIKCKWLLKLFKIKNNRHTVKIRNVNLVE